MAAFRLSEIMKQKFLGVPQYFFVVFFVMTTLSAVLLVEVFRTHTTDLWIVVQARDAGSAAIAEQIVENSVEFPKTLGFYEMLLAGNKDVTDPWQGMSPSARRSAWGGHIRTERSGKGSIVHVTISGNSVNESRILMQKVVTTLDKMLRQTYGADAVTIKSLDGPYSETSLSSPVLWSIASVAGGTILSALMFVIARVVDPLVWLRRPARQTGENIGLKFHPQSWEVAEAAARLKQQGLVDATAVHEEPKTPKPVEPAKTAEPVPQVPAAVVTAEPKAFAPSNLPFVDGEFSWESQLPGFGTGQNIPEEGEETKSSEPEQVSEVPTQEEQSKGEPTEEELKRRLNQLLRGKM